MTEIPEHLRKRSAEARAKKSDDAAPAGEPAAAAPAADPAPAADDAPQSEAASKIPAHLLARSKAAKAKASGTEVEPAAAAAPAAAEAAGSAVAPAASAAAPAVYVEPEPAPVAPYVAQYQERKKLPFWIIPVLVSLPVWGIFYFGTLERVPQGLTGLLGEGEEYYVESGCSGCHGAEGGGGIGPSLRNGEVHLTFTTLEDQIVWIVQGSAVVGTGNNYASPDGRVRQVAGQMPGFGLGAANELNFEFTLGVTLFERTQFGNEDFAVRDLELTEQLNLMIETGDLEAILNADGLSLNDVLDPQTVNRDVVNQYLAPAREALAAQES